MSEWMSLQCAVSTHLSSIKKTAAVPELLLLLSSQVSSEGKRISGVEQHEK